MKKTLHWLDNNVLLILSSLLLIVVPLLPKLPLFDIIPGYIVRVRAEDFLIVLTGIIWFVQVVRKKARWNNIIAPFVILYAVVGLLSSLSAILITKTVPLQPLHVAKTLLHYFRYLEYFAVLFFTASALKTRKDLKIMLLVSAATLLAVSVYGFGQKYFYWPVYSTMNREFSKGIRLYLTEHARVQSTFGGHYDLAGYLVIVLPFVLTFFLSVKKTLLKFVVALIYAAGLWLLIVSAARAAFIAFIVSTGVIALLLSTQKEKLSKRLWYFFSRIGLITLVTIIFLLSFGDDMSERLLQSLEGYPEVHTNVVNLINTTERATSYIVNRKWVEKPKNAMSTDEFESSVLVSSDERPVSTKPSDVYVEVPDIKTITTIGDDGSIKLTQVEVPRVYSENALKYGLSAAIRLDYLWPKAIEGFGKNPLLGSGYATLTKEKVYQFTEAESTDNNFLRTLGETGLLGFLIFYGIIFFSIYWAYQVFAKERKNTSNKEALFTNIFVVGYIAASVGLLLNATYIDVYASSKVALTYWSFTGILASIVLVNVPENTSFYPKVLTQKLPKRVKPLFNLREENRTHNKSTKKSRKKR